MWIMAVGAVIGGIDYILGNRFGFGKRFEEGFLLLGPTALSMAGIICLTPILSLFLKNAIVPLWVQLGLDPAMLGGILAIDMGGYQLAKDLAISPNVGIYSGLIVAATFGCTITFTIPVGMGMIEQKDQPVFARGMLIGIGMMPISLIVGGLLCKLRLVDILIQSLPIVILSILLMIGIGKFPKRTVKGFSIAALLIKILATVGLIAGTVCYMTGWNFIPNLSPIEDAMAVVSSIGVVMLGSLPIAELLQRLLKCPLSWIGKKTGMNNSSIAGLLIGIVSPVPAIVMIKDMDRRGKVVNAAFLVCAASTLAAHMGFTFSVERDFVLPLLCSKLVGGMVGVVCALIFTR